MRERVAAGEDIEQLQQEAYKDLGIRSSAPSTKVPPARRSNLSREEQHVFDLKAEETSPVLESTTEFVILKLVSKQEIPLDSVRQEIVSVLQPERMQQELQNASKGIDAEFNLKYLELASTPELFLPPLPTRAGMHPGAKSDIRSRMMSSRRTLPNPMTRPSMTAPRQ
jgi:hypothetical protein